MCASAVLAFGLALLLLQSQGAPTPAKSVSTVPLWPTQPKLEELYYQIAAHNRTVIVVMSGTSGYGKNQANVDLAAKFSNRSPNDPLPNLVFYGPDALGKPEFSSHTKRFFSWCQSSTFRKCFMVFDDYHLVPSALRPSIKEFLGNFFVNQPKSPSKLVLVLVLETSSLNKQEWKLEQSLESFTERLNDPGTSPLQVGTQLVPAISDVLQLEYDGSMMQPIANTNDEAYVLGYMVPLPDKEALRKIVQGTFNEVVTPAVWQFRAQEYNISITNAGLSQLETSSEFPKWGVRYFLRWSVPFLYHHLTSGNCWTCTGKPTVLDFASASNTWSCTCAERNSAPQRAEAWTVSTFREWTARSVYDAETCGLRNPPIRTADVEFAQPVVKSLLQMYSEVFSYSSSREPLILAFVSSCVRNCGQREAKSFLLRNLFASENPKYCTLHLDAADQETKAELLPRIHQQIDNFSRSVIYIQGAETIRPELLAGLHDPSNMKDLRQFKPENQLQATGTIFVMDFSFLPTAITVGTDQVVSVPTDVQLRNEIAALLQTADVRNLATLPNVEGKLATLILNYFQSWRGLVNRLRLVPFSCYPLNDKQVISLWSTNARRKRLDLQLSTKLTDSVNAWLAQFSSGDPCACIEKALEICSDEKLDALRAQRLGPVTITFNGTALV